MRILFIYGNVYALGGVQTWLARVLPRVAAEGHDVALLTRPRGEPWDATTALLDGLPEDVTVHVRERNWFKAPRSLDPPPPAADVLFACSLEALLLAALLQRHAMPEARILAGAFHPREYCSQNVPLLQRRWGLHLTERLIRRLPVENLVLCTPGTGWQMGRCLGRDLSGAPVLPIPIDTERFRPSPDRVVERGKVVSVARLAPQYAHHAQMIGVIGDLRDRGHEFSYHAYGDGSDLGALEARARELGVDDAVFFHGATPYSRFTEVVDDAFAFIGTGTALIEAAACGVPALLAISGHSGPMTYGFIQDAAGEEIGGYVPGHPQHPIAERLLWLADRSADEYAQAEQAARRRAEGFDVTRLIPRLLDILGGAAPCSLPISAADRALGRLDWMLEAVLLNLGAPDGWSERYVRDMPVDPAPAASSRR